FLTSTEIDALLAAPDLTTWSGRRDRALLLLAVRTGMRASEITTFSF
ncbi:MAG: integrase/recombinase XerD, partial [Gammaproteobacteria bacterium]|nr:integrase/recombinase XerD [Gammaproteobacteria bacterium]